MGGALRRAGEVVFKSARWRASLVRGLVRDSREEKRGGLKSASATAGAAGYARAIMSISTRKSRGRRATSTVVRAGGLLGK